LGLVLVAPNGTPAWR